MPVFVAVTFFGLTGILDFEKFYAPWQALLQLVKVLKFDFKAKLSVVTLGLFIIEHLSYTSCRHPFLSII